MKTLQIEVYESAEKLPNESEIVLAWFGDLVTIASYGCGFWLSEEMGDENPDSWASLPSVTGACV